MMIGTLAVPTGIKKGEPLAESIRKIDACVRNYGLERVMDRVMEFREYPWVGHRYLHESCTCLSCELERHLFKLMERGFEPNEPLVFVGGVLPIERPLFTGKEKFEGSKW